MRSSHLLTVAGALCFASAISAGPTFDDILNYAVVDQQCPPGEEHPEGLVLAVQGKTRWAQLSKASPLGQRFTLGPKADKLWRVVVGICHWPDSWQPGEEVTFSLYDSPAKAREFYSRTLTYDHKWSKWDTPFDVHLKVQPGASFYLELTHNGAGDDLINVTSVNGDQYPSGQAYVAGSPVSDTDLTFVAITKPRADREQNLRRFISRFNLDHPSMSHARAAYEKGDLDSACRYILKAFEDTLRKADWVWRPAAGERRDMARIDRVVNEGRYYNNDKGKEDEWIPMTGQTTWREVWPDTSEYVRHNDLFRELGVAYAATGKEKYAHKLGGLMIDLVQDNASPFEGGLRGGRWVAMFQAWRLGDAWDGFAIAVDSRGLSEDARLAWLDYNARMAHFAITEPSGGNHANAVAEALMKFAQRFPMYADSSRWFEAGYEKLVSNSLTLFRPDGGCVEPAMNYHGFSLANLLSGLETASELGLQTPPEILDTVQNALSYTAYMLKPDGQIPSYGDTDCEEFRPGAKRWDGWRTGEAAEGAKRFNRSDLLWIATAGREGAPPSETSRAFPDTGHYILRSDWGGEGSRFEDARYLFLRGGRHGSHGHDDLNSITLYAYGRPLLIDPGRSTYGTPLMYELARNRSHSVLLVDDQMMQHPAPTLNAWHTSPAMDVVDNSYSNLYPGVSHRRAVVFIRPAYYVLLDFVSSDAAHNYGINFWTVPPAPAIDPAKGTVRTTTPDAANLLLQAADPSSLRIAQRNGTIDLGGQRNDIPVVTFWRDAQKSAEFATLLMPIHAGHSAADAAFSARPLQNPSRGSTWTIETEAGTDLLTYEISADSTAGAASPPAVSLVRMDSGGKVTSFALINRSALSHEERLAYADSPIRSLSVSYTPEAVEVVCPDSVESLAVATQGRAKAKVNGKTVAVRGSEFFPFR